jgi:pilus assembly protein Flp/PilA
VLLWFCKPDQLAAQGEKTMNLIKSIWNDNSGQDLIEYALMAGFVAVAAGAVAPNIATNVSTVFSKVNTKLSSAAAQG